MAALVLASAVGCGGGTPAGGADAGPDAGTPPDAGASAESVVPRQGVVAGGGAAASPQYRGRFSVGGPSGAGEGGRLGPMPQPIRAE